MRGLFLAAGVASWFIPPPMYGSMHVCASNTIPISTRILIRWNGRQSDCTIIGTGPFRRGRILDVSESVARALGFLSRGTAFVRIYQLPKRSMP